MPPFKDEHVLVSDLYFTLITPCCYCLSALAAIAFAPEDETYDRS